MQNLQPYLIFATAARLASFAQAARAHGVTPSTVAKSIQRLERDLGVRLFQRTTRHVSLTPEGEAVYANCRRLLAEYEQLQAAAAGARNVPQGLLRISVPLTYGRNVLMPILARLARQHPQLELDVQLGDGYCDLVREGFDAAVRAGELHDSTLVARRIDTQDLVLCASPALLDTTGVPRTVAALRTLPAVLFRMPTSGRDRPWLLRERGHTVEVQPPAAVRCNDGEAMAVAALEGLGAVQLPHYMVDGAIERGELVELLPTRRPPAMDISVVYPSSRQLAPRVRALVDALVGAQLDQGSSRRSPSGR
ncbi:MAG: LysR family transcriptional regulator [Telluria sp.]